MTKMQIKTFKFDLDKLPEGEHGCDEIDDKINTFLKLVTDNDGSIVGVESVLNNSIVLYLIKYVNATYCM